MVSLTLHVGLGTFQPVKEERIEDHNMHSEYFVFTESAAQTILEAKEKGGKVVAVGTTVVRVLESIWQRSGTLKGMEGETNLFIYPGFHFIDRLADYQFSSPSHHPFYAGLRFSRNRLYEGSLRRCYQKQLSLF